MSLYTDASLIMYPSGVKASKIYSQKPTDGSGDLTFARVSTKTYIDANEARQTAASNVMPVSYEGGGCGKFNFEPQRTNLLLNSNTLSTQNITTTAQSYVLSFEGTGTVTLSGTYAGSLVGTGSTPADRVNLVFTATAGTLTVTVSGSVLNAQIEASYYATSYIPTAGSTVTRLADSSRTTGLSSVINSVEGVAYFKLKAINNPTLTTLLISISDGSNTNNLTISYNATGRLDANLRVGGVYQFICNYTGITSTDWNKIAVKYKANDFAVWVNGTEVFTDASGSCPSVSTFSELAFGAAGTGVTPFLGQVQEAALFPTALSDAQLEALTTL